MQRLRVLFRKGEEARFLSHLDLMATLEYALRRAGLPVVLSEGFNPRPRLSLAAPLALGYTGEEEILEIALRDPLDLDEVQQRLGAVLPPGIAIRSVREIMGREKPAASRLASATYQVDLRQPVPDLERRIADLLRRPTLPVEEQRQDRIRKRDLRPLIFELVPAGSSVLRLRVRLDAEGTIRPEQILDLLSIPRGGVRITRERIELRD